MRRLVLVAALLGASAVASQARNGIPDLKGTWTGKGKSIVFGHNPHHPGAQTVGDSPRVHEIEATYGVEGQNGRVAWGHSSSTAAATNEPFAWAIAGDNCSIIGADVDGYFSITLVSRNRIEKCYVQNAASPSTFDMVRKR